MKIKSVAMLSIALAVCMLGGCAENTKHEIVVVSTPGELSSSESSEAVSSLNSNEKSSSSIGSINTTSGSSIVSEPAVSVTKPQVSVVIPQISSSEIQESTKPEETFSSNVVSSSKEEPAVSSSSSAKPPIVTSSSSVFSSSDNSPVTPSFPIGTNSYQALNYSEVKGIWISYLELSGLVSDSESSFRNSIGKVYDNCVSLGINTVVVHVRSHGDAYYNSSLFPRTKYLGGNYDPLSVMIDEAHKRGLSFQAWINPLRGCSVSDIGREAGYPMYEWAGNEKQIVSYNGYYYLNPAYDEVIDLIAKGASEIVSKYNVDGLHIDDYFYPTTEEWFDSEAYSNSSYSSLSDFRFANCDKLVSSLYSAVKSANNTALFGVSPQGNVQNNYSYMYADVEKWCSESGYLDYIMPQIYFGFKNSYQPFSDVVTQWDAIAAKGNVPLIVGLSPAKIGREDTWGGDGKYEWINDKEILKRQFIESSEQKSYGGICLYSYNSIFNADSDTESQMNDEVSALKAVLQ